MRILTFLLYVLMSLGSLSLAGCGGIGATAKGSPAAGSAAQLTAFADVSTSNAEQSDPALAARAAHLVAEEFGRFRLGDTAQVYIIGDRSLAHAISPPPIATGYRNRLPAATKALEAQIDGVFTRYRQKGDGSTNILFTLQNAHPVCTPGSELMVLTDGVEESDAYSVSPALSAGQAIELPAPPQPFLRGCRVQMIGLGVSADRGGSAQQMLSTAQMAALEKGWSSYFVSAGVRPGDIRFRSIL